MNKTLLTACIVLLAQLASAIEVPRVESFEAVSKMRINGQTYLSAQVLNRNNALVSGVLQVSECYGNGRTISISVSASGSNTDYNSYGSSARSLILKNGDNNMYLSSAEECQELMKEIKPDPAGLTKQIVFDHQNDRILVNQKTFNLR